MRRILQRLAAGLLAPLLLVGGVASTGELCPGRLGIAVEDPCPCNHGTPAAGQDWLVHPCCCDEMGQAPASSAPVALELERVQGPTAPILIVGEGLSLAVADVVTQAVPVDRPAGAGPPILQQTSILLI